MTKNRREMDTRGKPESAGKRTTEKKIMIWSANEN